MWRSVAGMGCLPHSKALRRLTDDVTAIVGVADDGGSSGRIRGELGLPPPGDLRMALAALCGDDAWGRTWSQVMQHRFGGTGEMAGHATGNLLIAALWEETGNLVAGLDWVAALLGAHGRVLPVATVPLNIVADVRGADPAHPNEVKTIVGQVELEHSPGWVMNLRVEPRSARVCRSARGDRWRAGDCAGTGKLVHQRFAAPVGSRVREALAETSARRILVLNLDGRSASSTSEVGSTQDFTSARYLDVWREQFPEVGLEYVLADPRCVDDVDELVVACAALDAELVLERVSVSQRDSEPTSPRHDTHLWQQPSGTCCRMAISSYGNDFRRQRRAQSIRSDEDLLPKGGGRNHAPIRGGLHIVSGKIVIEAELDTGSAARRLRTNIKEVYGHDAELAVVHAGGSARGTVTSCG